MNILAELAKVEAPPDVCVSGPGRIVRCRSREEAEHYALEWDALAGNHPFRGRMWNMHWWDVYGRESPDGRSPELCVLVWLDDRDRVRALAPWYLRRHPLWGRMVSFLGEHEVCGDYLGLLCRPGLEEAAARRFADYLLGSRSAEDDPVPSGGSARESRPLRQSRPLRESSLRRESSPFGQSDHDRADSPCPRWDVLDLAGVEVAEPTVSCFVDLLREAGCLVDQQPAPSGWRIPLPAAWPDYLAGLSFNARRRFRRIARQYLQDARLQLRRVTTHEELRDGLAVLERLHQALWNHRGLPGCFASPRFREFHRRLARDMAAQDRLNLVWLEWEGRPIVAEYQFSADGTLYTYQSGMNPEAMHLSPGNLGNLLCIEAAIRDGYQFYDFCRGDEPYKVYFGAQPRPMCRWRIAAPRLAPRLRLRLWQWAKSARRFARLLAAGLGRTVGQASPESPESPEAGRTPEKGNASRDDAKPAGEA